MKRLPFVFVSAVISVVASERMFWFWSTGLRVHLELALYYSFSIAVVFSAIARYRVDGWSALLLATPLYAYVTEGLITPILYTGGPFVPFFPAWFSFWHGIMAVGVLLFGVRSWVLRGRLKRLAWASVGLGLFWGTWLSTSRMPANANDQELIDEMGELVVLGPAAFARYAALFTGVLIVAHWLLGFVWPASFEPGKWSCRLAAGLIAIGLVSWTVAIPWALPMFVAYAGLQLLGLRRHRDNTTSADLFFQLHGRTPIKNLWPLVLMAPTAAGSYAALWAVNPSEFALQIVFYTVIAVQTVLGAWLTIRSLIATRVALTDHLRSGGQLRTAST